MFLVGAYQEILGDLHNLFGDTHAVHVSLDEQATRRARRGDQGRHGARSARLRRVRRRTRCVGKFRTDVEAAVREGRVDYEESGRLLRFYEDGLHGYTYLEEPHAR